MVTRFSSTTVSAPVIDDGSIYALPLNIVDDSMPERACVSS